jgi:hypothetical protein
MLSGLNEATGAAPADQIADRAKSQDHHRPCLRLGHRRQGGVQWPSPAHWRPGKQGDAAATAAAKRTARTSRTTGRTGSRRRTIIGHLKRIIWRVWRTERVIAGLRGFFAWSGRQITATWTGTAAAAAAADTTGATTSSAAGTSAKTKAETVTACRGIKEGKTALATSRAHSPTGARTRPAAS